MKNYGTDLQGRLLDISHKICEHERVYNPTNFERCVQWRAGQIALNPAMLDTSKAGFTVLSSTMQIDGGDMILPVYHSSTRDIKDGDWYAEDFLDAFDTYWTGHLKGEHEICLAQADAAEQQFESSRLVSIRSARTGEVVL